MTEEPKKRLGEILASKGYVSEGQVAQLLARAASSGKRLGDLLVAEGYITDEILRTSLAEQRKQSGQR